MITISALSAVLLHTSKAGSLYVIDMKWASTRALSPTGSLSARTRGTYYKMVQYAGCNSKGCLHTSLGLVKSICTIIVVFLWFAVCCRTLMRPFESCLHDPWEYRVVHQFFRRRIAVWILKILGEGISSNCTQLFPFKLSGNCLVDLEPLHITSHRFKLCSIFLNQCKLIKIQQFFQKGVCKVWGVASAFYPLQTWRKSILEWISLDFIAFHFWFLTIRVTKLLVLVVHWSALIINRTNSVRHSRCVVSHEPEPKN